MVPTEYDSALIEKLFPIAQVSLGNPRSFLMAHLTKCLYVCIVRFGLARREPPPGVASSWAWPRRRLPPRVLSATARRYESPSGTPQKFACRCSKWYRLLSLAVTR